MALSFEERMKRAIAAADSVKNQGDEAMKSAKSAARDPLQGASDTSKKATKRHYKKIKYGVIDFCKKAATWFAQTKLGKTISTIGKYSGWTKLWNKTRPSKFSWKSAETPWQTFKNRSKTITGIAAHAWLLAWPLSIIPGLKSVPVAGEIAADVQEIGRYWTWEPAIDAVRMTSGAVKGEGFIRKEVVYLNSKNQTDIEKDIWGIQGTRKPNSMDDQSDL